MPAKQLIEVRTESGTLLGHVQFDQDLPSAPHLVFELEASPSDPLGCGRLAFPLRWHSERNCPAYRTLCVGDSFERALLKRVPGWRPLHEPKPAEDKQRVVELSVGLPHIAATLEKLLAMVNGGETPAFVLVVQAAGAAQYVSNTQREDGVELITSLLERWKQGRADIPGHYNPDL